VGTLHARVGGVGVVGVVAVVVVVVVVGGGGVVVVVLKFKLVNFPAKKGGHQ
jgi:hypothetical protein